MLLILMVSLFAEFFFFFPDSIQGGRSMNQNKQNPYTSVWMSTNGRETGQLF